MMTRTYMNRCLTAAGALFVGMMLVTPLAAAQATNEAPAGATDPRWQGWLGCWEPIGAPMSSTAKTHVVCVIPAEGSSAVDIATVEDGRVVHRQHLEATGQRIANTESGCKGWESAEWSADSRRVYLHSDYTCTGGLERRSNDLFAMSSTGEWLDVRGVAVGHSTGIRVLRYAEVAVPAELEGELSGVLGDRTFALNTARTAAGGTVSPADVIDASRHLDADVVQAWLVERHEGFALDAKQLVGLADAHVPSSVIDVMVALSYPNTFAVAPNGATSAVRAGELGQQGDTYAQGGGATIPVDMYPYDPWGYYYSPYSPYYSPYGYGFGYGWYWGGAPVVIVQQPGNGQPSSHGKVVKGHGYSRGQQADGGTMPEPNVRSGSGTSAGRASGGSSSGGSTRTAKPRP